MEKETNQNFPDNVLYEADNLEILRGMNSETVDLIATDPPFNTKRNRASSAGFYVDNWKWGNTGILPDQWKWNEVHPKWLEEIKDDHPALFKAIDAARDCQGDDTAAFLCFLSVRLLEMHRILKPTGSIYLHCDPTASHYIKMCMDAIWGKKNFRNEIIWRIGWVSGFKTQKRGWIRNHDTILYYLSSPKAAALFNKEYLPYPQGYVRRDGKPPTGKGIPLEDTWNCSRADVLDSIMIKSFSNEKTGSPDQKPLALYERIVKASSNEGDLVLDPFCGCATTIIAANNLNRRWVGIDRRVDARFHILTRLMGIPKKERERLKKFATDGAWLQKQMDNFDVYYRAEAPERTDNRETKAPKLKGVYVTENPHTHKEMKAALVGEFGCRCWGCNYEPPDDRYLHIDHIIPKSGGGTNHISNRAMLCQPCNSKKGNRLTLVELRKRNDKDGHTREGEPVDLKYALSWSLDELLRKARETAA